MTQDSFPLERTSGMQVFPFPHDGMQVPENPPVLIWLPLPSYRNSYRCTVTDTSEAVIYTCETTGNTVFPDLLLENGTYYWDVEAVETGIRRGRQRFTVAADRFIPHEKHRIYELIAAVCLDTVDRLWRYHTIFIVGKADDGIDLHII